jgi:TRAP transporter TAXI family solute receptor
MKFKTVVFALVCFILIGFPVFAGGGGEAAASSPKPAEKVEIRCGGSSVGGIFYVMAAAVATVVNKHVPEVDFSVQTTAGVFESYNKLVKGGLESFIQNCDVPYVGYNGGDPSRPALVPSKNIRTWFSTEASPFMVVTRIDNKKVTKFEDLWKPGVKIGTRPKGNTPHTLLMTLTEYAGQDSSKLDIYPGGHDQSATALRDGNIDVLFTGSGTLTGPNSAHQEMASATKIRMFDFPEPLRDKLVKELPYWGKFSLKPNWLQGQEQPCDVVAVLNSFFIGESVPEEIVYKMTKAVFENLDELKQISATAFGTLDLKMGAVNAVVPFHPGALRYFKEKGVEVSFLE